MGYRSDVKLVFYTSNESKIPFSAIKFWFDENYPVKEATQEWCATIEADQNYVLVSYEDVKWYDDYTHVQAVQNVISTFADTFNANEDTGAHYEIARVGEELTDIDHDHSGWCNWLLDVKREIIFN